MKQILDEFQAQLGRIELEAPGFKRISGRSLFRLGKAAWKPRLGWALAAAALLAGAVPALRNAARRYASERLQGHQSFALPFTSSVSLAVKEGALYTLDPTRGLLLALAVSGSELKILAVRKLPGTAAGGLAWGADGLWSSDPREGRIYRHGPAPGYEVMTTFSNPESRPSALCWDGRFLWTSDARTDTLLQYAVDRKLTLVRQYTLPGMVPVGIHPEGDTLWVFDELTRKAYAYALGGVLTARDSIDFRDQLPANCRVTGFAMDGASVWLITANPAEIHRFDLRHLKRKANAHGTAI